MASVVVDSSSVTTVDKEKMFKQSKIQQRNFLGTSRVIKLPYIIGTDEYKKHSYAGVVFMGDGEFEQLDLHQEEVNRLNEDKKIEEALLK